MALKHVAVVVGPLYIGIRLYVARTLIGVLTGQCMLNRVLNDRDVVLDTHIVLRHVTSETWNFVRSEALRSVMMLTWFHMLVLVNLLRMQD